MSQPSFTSFSPRFLNTVHKRLFDQKAKSHSSFKMPQLKGSAKGTSNQGLWQVVSGKRRCLALSLGLRVRKHLPDKGEGERGRRGFPKKREQMPKSSGANPHGFGGCKDLGNGWSMGACGEWEWGEGRR